MRITRIDLEGAERLPAGRHGLPAGRHGRYAIAERLAGHRGENVIGVTILTPETPNGRKRTADANDTAALGSLAAEVQRALDGYDGTQSEKWDYQEQLRRLAD